VFVNRRQADFVFRGDVHKRAVAGDDLCQDVSLYLKRAAKIGGGFRVGYATSIGGIERAAETIAPLLPSLQARELKLVLAAEDEPASAQRLGFVVEAGGAGKLAQIIYDWLPDKLEVVPLSPLKGERKSIPVIERWQVLNNSGELKL
jgi:hypothetical protein